MNSQKDALRAEARRARGMMSLDADAQKVFLHLFFEHIQPESGDVVAAYWPIWREFDTHILVEELWARGVDVVLPVVQRESRVMRFAHYTAKTEFEEWKAGILQPIVQNEDEFSMPDIVIVPLLAFDRRGNRLGYGGGYYDATLHMLKNFKDITTVGIGYAQQACLFNLPTEPHDVPLDWIITEQSAHRFIKDK